MAKKQDKKQDKKEAKVELGFGLDGFFGGLFGGIEKIIELAEKAEKAGGELRKEWELRGGSKERPMAGIYGFSIRTGLGKERSRIQTFGNIKRTKQGPRVVEVREPLVDVFDEKDSIGVIAELPGVQENEIKLEVKVDVLNLETKGAKKYAKEILLPAKVDDASKATSFKNGILEVKFKKI